MLHIEVETERGYIYIYMYIYIYIYIYICDGSKVTKLLHKAQVCSFRKSIGFIVFSLKNLSKMSVLRVLGSKNVIKQVQNHVFCSTCCIFSENPYAKMQKNKNVKKTCVAKNTHF